MQGYSSLDSCQNLSSDQLCGEDTPAVLLVLRGLIQEVPHRPKPQLSDG